MKVRVADIKEEGQDLAAEEAVTEYQDLLALQDGGEAEFLTPLSIRLHVVREYDHIRVKGTVQTAVRLNCSRCLADFTRDIVSGFTVFYSPAGDLPMDEEVELAEEDLVSVTYAGDVIDFTHEISEQVIMELPYKPLCRDDCQGLCATCGADLNTNPCTCPPAGAGFSFSALKNLTVARKGE